MDYTIIIPAYNEEENIPNLLKKALEITHKIIVVDDGSTDKTSEISKKLGAEVIRHDKNTGKGSAIISALKECKSEFVVLIDGDGQHSPEEIPLLLEKLKECELVVGNRFSKNQFIPLHRLIANRTIGMLLKNRTSLGDPLCGFRAFSKKYFADLREREFKIDLEIVFNAVDKKLRICEVPISVNYHKGRKSKTTGFTFGLGVYSGLLSYALKWLI